MGACCSARPGSEQSQQQHAYPYDRPQPRPGQAEGHLRRDVNGKAQNGTDDVRMHGPGLLSEYQQNGLQLDISAAQLPSYATEIDQSGIKGREKGRRKKPSQHHLKNSAQHVGDAGSAGDRQTNGRKPMYQYQQQPELQPAVQQSSAAKRHVDSLAALPVMGQRQPRQQQQPQQHGQPHQQQPHQQQQQQQHQHQQQGQPHQQQRRLQGSRADEEIIYTKTAPRPRIQGFGPHNALITGDDFIELQRQVTGPTTGWEIEINEPTIQVFGKKQGEVMYCMVRAVVKGISAEDVYDMIDDPQLRRAWDDVFIDMEVVDQPDQLNQLVYSSVKLPLIQNRDFLVYNATHVDSANRTYMIMSKCAEDPRVPVTKKYIRGETKVSGYLIRPCDGGRSTSLSIMGGTDMKGDIPKMLTDSIAPKGVAGWVKQLQKSHRKYVQPGGGMGAGGSRRYSYGPAF